MNSTSRFFSRFTCEKIIFSILLGLILSGIWFLLSQINWTEFVTYLGAVDWTRLAIEVGFGGVFLLVDIWAWHVRP